MTTPKELEQRIDSFIDAIADLADGHDFEVSIAGSYRRMTFEVVLTDISGGDNADSANQGTSRYPS